MTGRYTWRSAAFAGVSTIALLAASHAGAQDAAAPVPGAVLADGARADDAVYKIAEKRAHKHEL